MLGLIDGIVKIRVFRFFWIPACAGMTIMILISVS